MSFWAEAVSERLNRHYNYEQFKKLYLNEWHAYEFSARRVEIRWANTPHPELRFHPESRWPPSMFHAVKRAMCKAFHGAQVTRSYTDGRVWWCVECHYEWPWFPKLLTADEKIVNALAGRPVF